MTLQLQSYNCLKQTAAPKFAVHMPIRDVRRGALVVSPPRPPKNMTVSRFMGVFILFLMLDACLIYNSHLCDQGQWVSFKELMLGLLDTYDLKRPAVVENEVMEFNCLLLSSCLPTPLENHIFYHLFFVVYLVVS